MSNIEAPTYKFVGVRTIMKRSIYILTLGFVVVMGVKKYPLTVPKIRSTFKTARERMNKYVRSARRITRDPRITRKKKRIACVLVVGGVSVLFYIFVSLPSSYVLVDESYTIPVDKFYETYWEENILKLLESPPHRVRHNVSDKVRDLYVPCSLFDYSTHFNDYRVP